MQAHKGVSDISIDTPYLKFGRELFEKSRILF